jgi:hypothetical protein
MRWHGSWPIGHELVAGGFVNVTSSLRLKFISFYTERGKRNCRYKVYFSIHDESETVRVFHLRHWAIKPVETGELEDLIDESTDSRSEPQGIT